MPKGTIQETLRKRSTRKEKYRINMTDSNTGDFFEKEKKHMKLIFERAYYLPENNDTEQQIISVSLKLLELLKEKILLAM